MSLHMMDCTIDEVIAAVVAAPVIERQVVDPVTEETLYDELTKLEAIAFVNAATWRCWMQWGRDVFYLRMELADEVVLLTSVAPV